MECDKKARDVRVFWKYWKRANFSSVFLWKDDVEYFEARYFHCFSVPRHKIELYYFPAYCCLLFVVAVAVVVVIVVVVAVSSYCWCCCCPCCCSCCGCGCCSCCRCCCCRCCCCRCCCCRCCCRYRCCSCSHLLSLLQMLLLVVVPLLQMM